MDREIPILFKSKVECCACGACLNICPKQAISMQEDEYGFLYPRIDESLCIRCGKCKIVCAFQNTEVENEPLKTYAGIAKDEKLVKKSASGGIFAGIAQKTLECSGVVFGASFNQDWSVHHIYISGLNDLHKLQGSKYTQSSTGKSFSEVKKMLAEGKSVLYSGTPCQVAGLYGYLGRDDEHLLAVDIICHGVPNNRMFQEYIHLLEQNNGGKVTAFTFRDKDNGWGTNGSVKICGKKTIKLWQSASSYLYYFSKGWIYRESCYQCKYACSNRPADLTIGDYWGIEKVHPDYLGKNGWNEEKGISVVIANTEKGKKYLESSADVIELRNSTFKKAAEENSQLKNPSSAGKRLEILCAYKEGKWIALEERFRKNVGLRKYSSQIKAMIPKALKRKLKSL